VSNGDGCSLAALIAAVAGNLYFRSGMAARPSPSQLSLSFAAAFTPPGRPGRELDRRNGTEYREMTCRSVLTWVQGTRASDFFSANPYRGCEFGCAYCYARYTHEFLQEPRWEDFERHVYVKVNAPEALDRDLRRKRAMGNELRLGTATDPYQPAERRFGVTRKMLEKLLRYRGLSISLATKSGLVERDAPLLAELARRHEVHVHLSCASVDAKLLRRLEPRSPTPELRFRAMAALAARGVTVGLLAAPVMPGLADSEEDLVALFRRAREAGASSILSQALFLPSASKRRFFPWLERNAPELYERYRRAYRGGLEPNRPAEGRSSSGPLVRGLEPNRTAEGRSSSGPLVRGLEFEAEYRLLLARRIEAARVAAGFGGGARVLGRQ
jgi:DNA repair photolyase